jgi:hypothetical protein
MIRLQQQVQDDKMSFEELRKKNEKKKRSICLTDLKRVLILIFLQPRRFIWCTIDRYIVA